MSLLRAGAGRHQTKLKTEDERPHEYVASRQTSNSKGEGGGSPHGEGAEEDRRRAAARGSAGGAKTCQLIYRYLVDIVNEENSSTLKSR